MNDLYRVPDGRYRHGWRYTTLGYRRARLRKRAIIVFMIGLVLFVLVHALGVTILLGTVIYYAVASQRIREQARLMNIPVHQAVASSPVYSYPVGETRQRKQIPADVRIAVWNRDQGKCAHCRISDNDAVIQTGEHLQYDHVIPFSRNGADTVNNIQLLCKSCNASKGNRFVG